MPLKTCDLFKAITRGLLQTVMICKKKCITIFKPREPDILIWTDMFSMTSMQFLKYKLSELYVGKWIVTLVMFVDPYVWKIKLLKYFRSNRTPPCCFYVFVHWYLWCRYQKMIIIKQQIIKNNIAMGKNTLYRQNAIFFVILFKVYSFTNLFII